MFHWWWVSLPDPGLSHLGRNYSPSQCSFSSYGKGFYSMFNLSQLWASAHSNWMGRILLRQHNLVDTGFRFFLAAWACWVGSCPCTAMLKWCIHPLSYLLPRSVLCSFMITYLNAHRTTMRMIFCNRHLGCDRERVCARLCRAFIPGVSNSPSLYTWGAVAF